MLNKCDIRINPAFYGAGILPFNLKKGITNEIAPTRLQWGRRGGIIKIWIMTAVKKAINEDHNANQVQ